GGLRLERAELYRQRVQIAARGGFEIVDRVLLRDDRASHGLHFAERMIARVGENQRGGKAQGHETQGTGAEYRRNLGASAPAAKIQRSGTRTGMRDDYDVHAFAILRIQVIAIQPGARSSTSH